MSLKQHPSHLINSLIRGNSTSLECKARSIPDDEGHRRADQHVPLPGDGCPHPDVAHDRDSREHADERSGLYDLFCKSPEKEYAEYRPVGERRHRQHGVHAAAACDREGNPLHVREDIGRHNAVDKVVGRLLLDGALPASDLALYASGRASFEIVQKAWAAGMRAVVAVSAPSALAVAAADMAGITLCGFAREGAMNVYSGSTV